LAEELETVVKVRGSNRPALRLDQAAPVLLMEEARPRGLIVQRRQRRQRPLLAIKLTQPSTRRHQQHQACRQPRNPERVSSVLRPTGPKRERKAVEQRGQWRGGEQGEQGGVADRGQREVEPDQ